MLDALSTIADSTTSTAAQRLFAAEAQDAVRFVEAMSRRYTAVLMNPPFGEPVPATKKYLKAAYPWLPKFEDLLAAFVGRGLELSQHEVGTCGAITSRAGLFLKTYEGWRHEVLLAHQLAAMADFGYGVMEQAVVEACAYVLKNEPPRCAGVFVRLTKETDRPASMRAASANARVHAEDDRVFRVPVEDLAAVPGSPVAYWMTEDLRSIFLRGTALEGRFARVRQGLTTSDDFRFVRTAWEVNPSRIGYEADEFRADRKWAPFAKGGDYSPYWADVHLLVDWADSGRSIKETVNEKYPYLNGNVSYVVKNEDCYFEPGLTWPRRTNSGFGIRLLPRGVIFADKGSAVLPQSAETTFCILGWLRSRLIQALLDSMVAGGEQVSSGGGGRSYEVGLVQKLPMIVVPQLQEVIGRLVRRRA
ncbi:MAG: hypothetical protein KC561_19580, partial [Myxococcales bacterium]|nr:hypothetical protein [Myxococcales bacterium]